MRHGRGPELAGVFGSLRRSTNYTPSKMAVTRDLVGPFESRSSVPVFMGPDLVWPTERHHTFYGGI